MPKTKSEIKEKIEQSTNGYITSLLEQFKGVKNIEIKVKEILLKMNETIEKENLINQDIEKITILETQAQIKKMGIDVLKIDSIPLDKSIEITKEVEKSILPLKKKREELYITLKTEFRSQFNVEFAEIMTNFRIFHNIAKTLTEKRDELNDALIYMWKNALCKQFNNISLITQGESDIPVQDASLRLLEKLSNPLYSVIQIKPEVLKELVEKKLLKPEDFATHLIKRDEYIKKKKGSVHFLDVKSSEQIFE